MYGTWTETQKLQPLMCFPVSSKCKEHFSWNLFQPHKAVAPQRDMWRRQDLRASPDRQQAIATAWASPQQLHRQRWKQHETSSFSGLPSLSAAAPDRVTTLVLSFFLLSPRRSFDLKLGWETASLVVSLASATFCSIRSKASWCQNDPKCIKMSCLLGSTLGRPDPAQAVETWSEWTPPNSRQLGRAPVVPAAFEPFQVHHPGILGKLLQLNQVKYGKMTKPSPVAENSVLFWPWNHSFNTAEDDGSVRFNASQYRMLGKLSKQPALRCCDWLNSALA